MKNASISFIVAVVLVTGYFATAKTINPPVLTIERAIELANDYVKAQKIDVSLHFLAAVEYKNLHNEYEKPFWRLEWRLLAGTSDGHIVVIVHPDSTASREASEKPDASGPDTAEMVKAVAMATASLRGVVDSPGDFKLIKMELVWRKGSYVWESTYKLRSLLPENPGEEIVGAGGEIFITINLKTEEAEIRYGE